MAFLLEREPLNRQGGKCTFTTPDGREVECKVFLDGVSVSPNERTELDLNAIPQLLFVEELWNRLHGKK